MLKYYADGEKGMQRTNILNLDIKQSKLYGFFKAAVAALALCTGIFNACRAIFASVRKGRSLGVRFVARRAVASVDGAAVFCAPVYSFCLRYKE